MRSFGWQDLFVGVAPRPPGEAERKDDDIEVPFRFVSIGFRWAVVVNGVAVAVGGGYTPVPLVVGTVGFLNRGSGGASNGMEDISFSLFIAVSIVEEEEGGNDGGGVFVRSTR